MHNSRPTLKDVALRSGYALRTVKKVMNGETVREKTRLDVLKAAEELNYVPNRAASALARNRRIRLAVVYSHTSEAYFPEVEQGFRACVSAHGDFGLELEFCVTRQSGWQPQDAILRQLLGREDIDGVILQPFSSRLLNEAIDLLVENGKPVITFGADAPESKRLCYIGPDAYRSGRIGGQILANYVGKSGKVYIINQGADHMQTMDRTRGFLDRIREHYPKLEAYQVDLPDDSSLYYDMVKNIVEKGQANGLFCTDANTFVAGQVLKDLNIRDIALVGFDLSPDGVRLMREGHIKVIIEQKPADFSCLAAATLFRHITTQTPLPQHIKTPLYIITSECIEE